ncbi:MAG: hypothetical protein K9L60_10975 [Methylovulum sp.]|jgi:hypothetical protein|nr:hypothetical protein [Methylovulum sp.]MCF7999575.1 hypothetical protein [Methylovulum sp.]
MAIYPLLWVENQKVGLSVSSFYDFCGVKIVITLKACLKHPKTGDYVSVVVLELRLN